MKKTSLFQEHMALRGKMVDFNGWELPVQYSGIIAEHEAVRTHAGIFDVSHMGEILVIGETATEFLQKMLSNDVGRLNNNGVLYSLMCYEDGGVVDDLLVYKINSEKYLLVVNASNTDIDYQWLCDHNDSQVTITNMSDDYAQIAIQGPNAREIVALLDNNPTRVLSLKRFTFFSEYKLQDVTILISRTGYTGEDGFEIYLHADDAPMLWQKLLQAGAPLGLKPAGLGARDLLRFEACLPLYGHEISQDITPLEAGLKYFVKLKGRTFIGSKAIRRQKKEGVARKIIGLEMIDRGIPRSGYHVYSSEGIVGTVTSGSYSPILKKSLALILVDSQYAREGAQLYIEIKGKHRLGRVINVPFFKNI